MMEEEAPEVLTPDEELLEALNRTPGLIVAGLAAERIKRAIAAEQILLAAAAGQGENIQTLLNELHIKEGLVRAMRYDLDHTRAQRDLLAGQLQATAEEVTARDREIHALTGQLDEANRLAVEMRELANDRGQALLDERIEWAAERRTWKADLAAAHEQLTTMGNNNGVFLRDLSVLHDRVAARDTEINRLRRALKMQDGAWDACEARRQQAEDAVRCLRLLLNQSISHNVPDDLQAALNIARNIIDDWDDGSLPSAQPDECTVMTPHVEARRIWEAPEMREAREACEAWTKVANAHDIVQPEVRSAEFEALSAQNEELGKAYDDIRAEYDARGGIIDSLTNRLHAANHRLVVLRSAIANLDPQ